MYEREGSPLQPVLASLAELLAAPIADLPDGELRALANDCADGLSQMQALAATVIGAFDARLLGAEDGMVNTAAWFRQRGVDDVSRRVKIAAGLRDRTPITAAAMRSGALTYDKAAVIAMAVPKNLADAFALSEQAIVDAAVQVDARDVKRLMGSWKAIAEDAAGLSPFDRAHAERTGRWAETFGGGLELSGLFDQLTGGPLKGVLDAKVRELFLADVAEARALAGLPHDPDDDSTAGLDLPRTNAQRQSDAIAQLILAGAGLDATFGVGGPSAVLHVTVPADTLARVAAERARREGDPNAVEHADLAGHAARHRLQHAVDQAIDDTLHPHRTHAAVLDDFDTPIGRELLELLACDCVLEKVLLDPNGVPLELGRQRRLASREQRRALRIRDGGCAFPGCDRPPSWCDAHHITPWFPDGPTDLDNLVLLCRTHHTYLHRNIDRWVCRMNPTTRRPEFTDPTGRLIPTTRGTSPPGHPPDGRPPDGRRPHEHPLAPAA
jgi:hypothetical protein